MATLTAMGPGSPHAVLWRGARIAIRTPADTWIYSCDSTPPCELVPTSDSRGQAPAARWGHTASWSASNAVVICGGRISTGIGYEDNMDVFLRADLKEVGGTWSRVQVSGAVPSGRRRSSSVISGSDLLVFGGYNGNFLNDLAYLRLPPPGRSPTADSADHVGKGEPWREDDKALLESLLPCYAMLPPGLVRECLTHLQSSVGGANDLQWKVEAVRGGFNDIPAVQNLIEMGFPETKVFAAYSKLLCASDDGTVEDVGALIDLTYTLDTSEMDALLQQLRRRHGSGTRDRDGQDGHINPGQASRRRSVANEQSCCFCSSETSSWRACSKNCASASSPWNPVMMPS